jgi:2,4-dienoyl-CoA reductase-like NADH-dependent reductase (Old Yellow Enzyme family)
MHTAAGMVCLQPKGWFGTGRVAGGIVTQPYVKIGHLKTLSAFQDLVRSLNLDLPSDGAVLSAEQGSPLAAPMDVGGFVVGNRWCVQPMEGWDGTTGGEPTPMTLRRWQHFGESGAKLVWGGEAFAVRGDARANPNQLGIVDGQLDRAAGGLAMLLETLLDAHRRAYGRLDDLLVGLQLTHSGRYCKPTDPARLAPRIAYHHPLLDVRCGIAPDDDSVLLSDDDLHRIADDYVAAARLAWRVGFRFVDVKCCHGYLGHELLSAVARPGPFGGSLENRTRFLRLVIQGIQAECPGLLIGVRLSAFDLPPFRPDPARSAAGRPGPGTPEPYEHLLPYVYGFGCDRDTPLQIDLTEPVAVVRMLLSMGVRLINVSGGSPYYNPHIQRPAMSPPSDGYLPPEDPLIGVHRQIHVARQLKQACPQAVIVGSGYTYLQEYLPHVAQAVVRRGWVDCVGFGRLALSYWDMPADTLRGGALQARRICRTFSDCTTAPRTGLISGCYPLDPYYKAMPHAVQLRQSRPKAPSSG